MSDIYDPKFDRKKNGNFNKNKAFVSVVGGTDSYFLEDEFNEMQWIQNEARADTMRASHHSGIYVKNDFPTGMLYSDVKMRPNLLSFGWMNALINGYLIEITDALGFMGNQYVISKEGINNVILPNPPDSGTRYDLVYLEMCFAEVNYQSRIWLNGSSSNLEGLTNNDLMDPRVNGETCRRIQMQWAIRAASSPFDSTRPVGFDETSNAVYIPAYGANTSQSDYGFWQATKNLTGNFPLEDQGLWIAGKGIAGDIGTIDGYSYAIPLFKVIRRNASAYSDSNHQGGSIYIDSTSISDRPDGKFSNIIYEDDITDLRNMISYDNGMFKNILQRNFSKLMSGKLQSSSKPKILKSYFGVDPIIPDADTQLYLNFNRSTSYNNIAPIINNNLNYHFVDGVEQQAISFDGVGSLSYAITGTFDRGLVTMMINRSNGLDKNLWSFRSGPSTPLNCDIIGNVLTLRQDDTIISAVDLANLNSPINVGQFGHIAVTWSKAAKKLYVIVNGSIADAVDITKMSSINVYDTFIIGQTFNKSSGCPGTVIDEVELANRFITSFPILPTDFISGQATIVIDMQKGRRTYTKVKTSSSMTEHIRIISDDAGNAQFSMDSLIGTMFTNDIPQLYFDAEAVAVNNATWSGLSTNTITCTISGLGPKVTYNLVVIFNLNFDNNQGLDNIPQVMYKAEGQELALPFMPVRIDKQYEEHLLDRVSGIPGFGSIMDRIKVYNPTVFKQVGFVTGIKFQMTANGTNNITIPKNIYGRDIITVYDSNVVGDVYRQNIISNIDMSGPNGISIIFGEAIETGTVIEIIAGTALPGVIYHHIAGGITNLMQVEEVKLIGDGATKEFIYTSQTKILNSLGAIIGKNLSYIAYIDGKVQLIDTEIIGSFAHFIFSTAPANKSNIKIYIVSEYAPVRSERFQVWYETLEYQGEHNKKYVDSLNGAEIVCHLDSIFTITDGANMPIETRLNKTYVNSAYLPISGPTDGYLIPTKIAGYATNMRSSIDYVEMNDQNFNDPLPILSTLQLNITQTGIGRGYVGYATVDNKSIWSMRTLTSNFAHLNILPLIIKDQQGHLKMAIITTYNDQNMIFIGAGYNESAIDIFDLDEKILIK